jgi:UDP-GlcNAc:undecaprenyl-phosphate GlcNAc-1-phosphate transferase
VKDYILTLLVAAAVTYLLTPLVRRMAIRFGAMHAPRERDVHTTPVPRGGGVAMYIGLAAGIFVAYQIPQLRTSFAPTGMAAGLLLAGGLLVAIGVVDDRWGMSALTKAAGQIAAGAILVATGTQLSWLPEPGGGTFSPTPDQSTLLTILIVVATINAVNFIDGLDGLAAGIVAISAVSFLIYYYEMTKVLSMSALAAPALASAILTGVCLGFLPHNFWPARIFMGDTGSMLLGLVLAYAPISSINSLEPGDTLTNNVNRYPEIMPLLLPAVLLVIPYADMLLAVVRRMRAGLSPFAADQKHLHHRLIGIGHSQRASVLVMYLWAALFSGSIVWFSLEKTSEPNAPGHHGEPILVFVVITAAAVLALVLMSLPWLRNRDRAVKAEVAVAGRSASLSAALVNGERRDRDLVSAAAAPAAPPAAAEGSRHRSARLPGGDRAPGGNGTSASLNRDRAVTGSGPAADLYVPAEPVVPAGNGRSVVGAVPPSIETEPDPVPASIRRTGPNGRTKASDFARPQEPPRTGPRQRPSDRNGGPAQ